MSSILAIEIIALAAIFYSVLLCSLAYRCTSFFVKNKDKLFVDTQMVQLNDSEESSLDSEENPEYYVKTERKIEDIIEMV